MSPTTNVRPAERPAGSPPPQRPSTDPLERARALLAAGQPAEAFAALRKAPDTDPWIRNARAVCLMRTGQPERAIEILHDLACDPGTVVLKNGANPLFVLNLATALLLAGNVEGCVFALKEVSDDEPSKQPLRELIGVWEAGLTRMQRFRRWLGDPPPAPRLETPPGVA